MFRKKKEYIQSDWFRGFLEAEDYMKEGWYFDKEQSSGNHVYFKHPQGGSIGWLGLNWSYTRGLLDYVEHRKLNGEIYESR